MLLFIDTSDREKAILALITKDKVRKILFSTSRRLSEVLPLKLKNLLRKNKAKFADLRSIIVVRGPGAFMSVRTGVAYANALAKSLNVPSAGITVGQIPSDLINLTKKKVDKKVITPKYSAPPNITKPKK